MSDLLRKSVAIGIPLLANMPSSFFMRNEVKTWYKIIKKPSFTPPNYVFGPMWTTLYTCMGYSSYLIFKEGGGFNHETRLPLILYGSQLILNTAWSWIFFARHKIGWAAVDSCLLSANVLACFFVFRPISKTASNLMIPYLAWLALATTVNIGTWQLNKDNPSMSE